jgi:non-heme chloroperoxidase
MPYVEINNTKLHYVDQGNGDPVILLHGVWMSSKFFMNQLSELSKSYRVIALDFRGHGQSEPIDWGHTIPQYADDLHQLITNLSLKKVTLIGWSMGAFVTWEYIARHGDENIKSSVVIDESASDFKWSDWPHGFADFPTLVHFMEMIQSDQTAVVDQFIPLMFKEVPAAEELQWMKSELLKLSPVTAGSILFDQTTRDYRQCLDKIKVPTLICFGRDEKLVPVEAAQHLHSKITNSEIVIFENSSHCPFIEESDSFNDVVVDFLSRVEVGSRLEKKHLIRLGLKS